MIKLCPQKFGLQLDFFGAVDLTLIPYPTLFIIGKVFYIKSSDPSWSTHLHKERDEKLGSFLLRIIGIGHESMETRHQTCMLRL